MPGFVPASAYEAAEDRTPLNDRGACRAGSVELKASPGVGDGCVAITEAKEWLEFRVLLESGGDYELVPAVNAIESGAAVEVLWDGKPLTTPFVIPRREEGHFARPMLPIVAATKGEHVVRVLFSEAPSAFLGFDVRSVVSDNLPKMAAEQEFEYGDPGSASVGASLSGFTGAGYLTDLASTGNAASVVVDVASAGLHQVYLRYATPDDGLTRKLEVRVSGSALSEVSLPAQASFGPLFVGEHWLDEGPNTIEVASVASGIWLDAASVKDGARNLARGGTATLSSVYAGNVASNAIDGETSGTTYAMSAQTSQPYLELDLGALRCVSSVVLHPRKDCCQNRLDGSDLFLGKTSGVWTATRAIEVGPSAPERYEFLGTEARFVRLALRGTNYLNLSELEVVGVPGRCGARPMGEVQRVRADQVTRYTSNNATLRRRYLDPIVVMGPAGYENTDIVVMRVSSPASDGFSFRLGEWEYRNGPHPFENVHFMVVERGAWSMPGGGLALFDHGSASSTASRISFAEVFAETPVVLAQVASESEFALVTHKAKNVTATGFDVRLVEQATSADGTHAAELLHYAVFTPGPGAPAPGGAAPFECAGISGVSSGFRTVSFELVHSGVPAIFASVQTDVDPRAQSIRQRYLSETSVQLMIEPENSAGTGALSGKEGIGYCAASVGTIFGTSFP